MNDQEWLAQRFEQHRTRLRAVSYRMLGSFNDADDAVQEACCVSATQTPATSAIWGRG